MIFNKKFNRSVIYNDIKGLHEAFEEGVGNINSDCYIVYDMNHALHIISYAAFKGYTEILEFLLQHGGNPDKLNMNKTTPMVIAIQYGQEKSIEILKKYRSATGTSGIEIQQRFGEDPIETSENNAPLDFESDFSDQSICTECSQEYWLPTGMGM